MSQAQLQLGAVPAVAAEDLFQPVGADETAAGDGVPKSERALATLAHLAARYRAAGQDRGFWVCGADHLVRDPVGRRTEVWRFHPDSSVWLELVEVRPDVVESPEDLELRIAAAEVRAA